VQDYHNRDDMLTEIDKMFFMDWEDKPEGENYKFTVSPSARNALLGAIRLMTSTEPIFNVPFEKNRKEAQRQSEKIEKLCQAIWFHSGRFRGVPLEQPAVESLLRYGMMVLAIYDTEDLKETIEGRGASKALKNQLDKLVNSTPYLIEVWDPKTVYPEYGRFGLTAVYRSTQMTVGEVKQQFGEDAVREIINTEHGSDNKVITYSDYWNLDKHIAWVSGSEDAGTLAPAGEPIVDEYHDLPCIPIVVQTSEGSYMDYKREHQAVPFLYSVWESGLWERQNLELTVMYTNLFNMGISPNFVNETQDENGSLEVDYKTPGGRIVLRPGEKYYQLQKDVISADLLQGLEIANRLSEQSTIYSQSLGQPLGANSAFSMVSLLHQAGRLPLVSPQKRGGWGMGAVMEAIFDMIKDKDEVRQVKGQDGGFLEIEVSEIPDDLLITAKLDIALPQDMMAQANIASMITQQGLASRRWARENILNIGQSDTMDKEMWNDTASEALYQHTVQKMIQQEIMQQQQAMQGQQGMPPQGPPRENPNGPRMAGSAMNTQEGLIPAQRPGGQPAPPNPNPQGLQRGEM
jgi:hypothetical protein